MRARFYDAPVQGQKEKLYVTALHYAWWSAGDKLDLEKLTFANISCCAACAVWTLTADFMCTIVICHVA